MEEFRNTYLNEANRLLSELKTNIEDLKKNGENDDLIYNIFRIVHSIKGGGAMFGFEKSSTLAGALEDRYEEIKDKEARLTPELIEITEICNEFLIYLINNEPELKSEDITKQKELIKKVKKIGK